MEQRPDPANSPDHPATSAPDVPNSSEVPRARARWKPVAWALVVAAIAGTIALQWYLSTSDDSAGIGSLIAGGGGQTEVQQRIGGTVPSDPLPILGQGDAKLALSELRGSPVVVNVWASTCAPCKAEMPAFERVWADVRQQSEAPDAPGAVKFIGIDSGEAAADGLAMIEATGVTYTNLSDPQQIATRSLGVAALPGTIFIDRDGTIRYAHAGAMFEDDLRQALRDHLEVAS